jgi:hypothetical protein
MEELPTIHDLRWHAILLLVSLECLCRRGVTLARPTRQLRGYALRHTAINPAGGSADFVPQGDS